MTRRGYKCQRLNKSENEESAKFDKSDHKYIPLSALSTQKKSNRLSKLDNTRSLIYLVSITKTKSY